MVLHILRELSVAPALASTTSDGSEMMKGRDQRCWWFLMLGLTLAALSMYPTWSKIHIRSWLSRGHTPLERMMSRGCLPPQQSLVDQRIDGVCRDSTFQEISAVTEI